MKSSARLSVHRRPSSSHAATSATERDCPLWQCTAPPAPPPPSRLGCPLRWPTGKQQELSLYTMRICQSSKRPSPELQARTTFQWVVGGGGGGGGPSTEPPPRRASWMNRAAGRKNGEMSSSSTSRSGARMTWKPSASAGCSRSCAAPRTPALAHHPRPPLWPGPREPPRHQLRKAQSEALCILNAMNRTTRDEPCADCQAGVQRRRRM